MNWLTLLIVSPLWAILSTILFLQGLLALINLGLAITGFMRGVIRQKNFLAATFASCTAALAFFSLLIVGFYVTLTKLSFGQSDDTQIVYGIVSFLTALYFIPKMWANIRKHWHECMMPGVSELDRAVRKSGQI